MVKKMDYEDNLVIIDASNIKEFYHELEEAIDDFKDYLASFVIILTRLENISNKIDSEKTEHDLGNDAIYDTFELSSEISESIIDVNELMDKIDNSFIWKVLTLLIDESFKDDIKNETIVLELQKLVSEAHKLIQKYEYFYDQTSTYKESITSKLYSLSSQKLVKINNDINRKLMELNQLVDSKSTEMISKTNQATKDLNDQMEKVQKKMTRIVRESSAEANKTLDKIWIVLTVLIAAISIIITTMTSFSNLNGQQIIMVNLSLAFALILMFCIVFVSIAYDVRTKIFRIIFFLILLVAVALILGYFIKNPISV